MRFLFWSGVQITRHRFLVQDLLCHYRVQQGPFYSLRAVPSIAEQWICQNLQHLQRGLPSVLPRP